MSSRRTSRHVLVAVLLAALVASASACGRTSSGAAPSSTSPDPVARPAVIRVLAASSLANVLPDLVAGFRRRHPDVTVETSTAASSALAEQVRAGIEADVVLTADRATADAARAAPGNQAAPGAPVPFATNTMVIAVPAGNPGEVRSLSALADPDLLVGLCAPQVPCGKYARQLLANAGVAASVDTEEPDARSLMAKVASGDLDAGLVYRTDVLAAGPTALKVDVPEASKVPVTYFAVRRSAGAADEFVDYLRGPGQRVLASAGFGRA